MDFRLREHTADVAVEATASDLGGVLAAVADGLAAAACESVPDPGADATTFEVSVGAKGREALLFDYLDRLIYERDVRGVLPVRNRAAVDGPNDGGDTAGSGRSIDVDAAGDARVGTAEPDDPPWRLNATARGVPLDRIDARDVKAVTYSEMRVEPVEDGWTAYVVFDV